MKKMKKNLYVILIFCALATFQTTLANTPQQIQENVNQVLKKYSVDNNVGIVVQSLTNHQTIYQKNAHQLFMPASILKTVTAIAALSFLGPEYNFTTKFLTKSTQIDRGIVNNDVYLYFDGDPSLTKNDLNNLVKKISDLGLKTINGNLYVDDTIFDDAFLAPGWVWEDLNYHYAAPISAIMLDKNGFSCNLTVSPKHEHLATLSNVTSPVSVINKVLSKNHRLTKENCAIKLFATSDNNYFLSGCLKTNALPQTLSIAIRNVRLYAKNLILEQLKNNQIKLLGSIEFRKIPENVELNVLADHKSAPLTELIKPMLKKSDNTYADAIYKKIGYEFFKQQATWQSSALAINKIFEAKKIAFAKETYMDDGSGLSRYNMITPALLVAVLGYSYYDTNIRQALTNALSHMGIDGTLQYRLPKLKNKIFAKTGNMIGVSSLTGYIENKNHEMLAFAIIINSFLDSPKKYHKLQDEICTILAN